MAFTTRRSLLEKVRRGDEISWQEFYETYRPLIRLCGGDYYLSEPEKDELVQQVMCEIFRKDIIGKFDFDRVPENVSFKYDPAKGRFRHYLRGIVRHQALRIIERRSASVSPDAVPELPAADVLEKQWDEEWSRHILRMGLDELRNRVRPETFMAFEMYAVQERPVEEVAAMLDRSVASVYTAKSRCIDLLREIITDMEGIS